MHAGYVKINYCLSIISRIRTHPSIISCHIVSCNILLSIRGMGGVKVNLRLRIKWLTLYILKVSFSFNIKFVFRV